MRNPLPVAVADEFASADIGDKRLNARLVEIGVALSAGPASSFPDLFGEDAAQEAFYRFLRNDRVMLEKVLQPHREATVLRMADAPLALILHDTSECTFEGELREGVPELRPGTYGFNVHVSLAVSADGRRHPYGVLAASVIDDAKSHRDRWITQALESQERACGVTPCIHVMDREADVYSLFATAAAQKLRFVVRAQHDRLLAEVDEQERTLLEELGLCEDVAEREVFVSERRKTKKQAMPEEMKARPPRNSRVAKLRFRACTVTFPRPQRQDKALPKMLKLNVVQVHEVDAPAGTPPVNWLLVTTEPIGTREQVLAVVDAYRTRWLIEEFFKALKTGCSYESRQLESYATLTVALGLFLPLAWHLLLLRAYGRTENLSGRAVMDENRLKILSALARKLKKPIPPHPTARDVMLGVAAIGGHIKQNGEPGWQVLWRGYKKLLFAEEVLLTCGEM
jgi:hypothetical protein